MEDAAITRHETRVPSSRKSHEDVSDSPKSTDDLQIGKSTEDSLAKNDKLKLRADEKNTSQQSNKSIDIETVFENIERTVKGSAISKEPTHEKKSNEPTSFPNVNEPLSLHDINNQRIYSVNGKPSGRINRRYTNTSNVFPVGCMGCKDDELPKTNSRRFIEAKHAADCVGQIENTPRKRCSSGKLDTQRNPVTGAGIESAEARRALFRRKDGNPVLGLGYDDSANSRLGNSGRVPPGGFSHGIW